MYFIILSVLFFSSVNFAMEIYSPFTVCRKIKQINPDAPQKEYVALVKEIQQSKLSVELCVQLSIQKRIENALLALQKEWQLSKEQWLEVSKFIEESKDENDAIEINDSANGALTHEMIDKIIAQFKSVDRINNKIKFAYAQDDFEHIMSVCQSYIVENGITDNKQYITADQYTVTTYPNLSFFSKHAKEGILLHEIHGHIKHNDSLISILLFIQACKNHPNLQQKKFYKSSSFVKFHNACEARADQLPATKSGKNATSMETAMIELAWMFDNPATRKRLNNATRIRKLKEAEERLLHQ